MNISPGNSPAPQSGTGGDSEMQFQFRRLRVLTQATAVSVLIITGTLFVFLYRQVVLVRRQTAELARYLSEVERSGMPDFMGQVRDKFNAYRKEHPDFNPIYARYFGTNDPPPAPARLPAAGPTNK